MTFLSLSPAPADNLSYGGANSQPSMGMAEILQLCCLGRRSGQIMFRSQESVGYVFVQHGQVLHATCGRLEGEDAIYAMLAWTSGTFTFADDVLPQNRTIDLTWEQLLFEGARRADEGLIAPQIATITETPREMAHSGNTKELPKLVAYLPDREPTSYEIQNEFTYLGRTEDSDIPLPIASVSSRHAVLVRSGNDIILRDLNSSNGTTVNGQPISEQVLRLGDIIHLGSAELRFELGFKRPKLRPVDKPVAATPAAPIPQVEVARGEFIPRAVTATGSVTGETLKLPNMPARPKLTPSATTAAATATANLNRDRSFVSGSRAISFDAIAPSETSNKKFPLGLVLLIVIFLLILGGGGAYYWMYLAKH